MAHAGLPLAAAAALALGVLAAAPARGAVCGGDFVSEGDTEAEVREKCGDPAQQETWRADLLGAPSGPPPAPVPAVAVFREAEWIYNPGPRHLLLAVRFRDGRVVRVESLENGFTPGRRAGDRCRTGLFDPGTPRVAVESMCGPPTEATDRTDRRTGMAFGRRARVHARLQAWTYDFGPRFFTRTYVFENGRLARIETGERGGD
jgi:hypothetical protein